jgi:hypothetical protein
MVRGSIVVWDQGEAWREEVGPGMVRGSTVVWDLGLPKFMEDGAEQQRIEAEAPGVITRTQRGVSQHAAAIAASSG